MPGVLGVNQLKVLSQSLSRKNEENQALELGTRRKETKEERGLLLGSTDPSGIFNLAC